MANYIWDRKNAHEALGAERLLKECGLIVLPEYRGHGIGLKLVETWYKTTKYYCIFNVCMCSYYQQVPILPPVLLNLRGTSDRFKTKH